MRTDPEPHDIVTLHSAQGAIPEADPRRVDKVVVVDLFEMESRVGGIAPEELVGSPRGVECPWEDSRTSRGNAAR